MRNSNTTFGLPSRLCHLVFVYSWILLPVVLYSQPQFVAIGDFTAPFTDLNQAATQALDYDGNGTIDIRPPCSCRALPILSNGTSPNGIFDNQLVIATGLSGQVWRLQTSINILRPDNLTTLPGGTTFTEIGSTGVYILPFAHRDDQIYFATVESPDYPNQSFGPVFGECYYPHPVIENLPSFFCSDEADLVLFGSAYSGFDDYLTPLLSQDEFWIIQRREDLEVFTTQVFSPSAFGEGTYDVRYTFNAGNQAYTDPNFTGCSVTIEETVIVREEAQMACFTELNVSIGPNCEGSIQPSQLLAAPQNTYEAFTIEIYDAAGNFVGDSIAAAFHGQTLTATIIDDCSGSNCSTLLNIYDVIQPVLSIPPNVTVSCTETTEPLATGFASATDCSSVTVSYQDEVITNECGNPSQIIQRTWTAIDPAGNLSSSVQTIHVARGSQSQLRFPEDVNVDCRALQLNPELTAASAAGAGLPNLINDPRCGLIYTSQDDTIPVCGSAEMVILREWTVLDVCGTIIYDTDGLGNDNMQIIRILDETAPEVIAENFSLAANVLPANPQEACRSLETIPPPLSVTDDCSTFFIQIFTPIGEVQYIDGQDGSAGGVIPAPGLTLGEHPIVYQATDECGNVGRDTVTVEIVDLSPPMMLCNSFLNLTLSPAGNGRLFPEDIDEGSNDACCTGELKIKLDHEPDSLFRDFIDFFCTNDTVTTTIRLYDCAGNFNECDSKVLVEDHVSVEVVSSLPDTAIDCGLDYSAFLDPTYRAPVFTDNCDFTTDFQTELIVNACGIGQLNRQWTARDHLNNPPAIVQQTVLLEAVHDYRFDIPGDRDIACNSNDFFTFIASSDGCDSLVVNVTEEILTDDNSGACYRIRRLYDVYNYCEWDGQSPPVQLPRRDGLDNDDEPGDNYVILSDGVFIYEVFSLSPNVLIEIGPSTGYYQYEQFLSVFDDDPPIINSADPLSVCIDSTDCLAAINFDISVADSCGNISSISYLLVPENDVPQIDTIGTLSRINIGQYRLNGRYPIGNYSFLIQASDDCGNQVETNYDFSVLDCIAPVLSCISDTTLVLANANGLSLEVSELVLAQSELCAGGVPAQLHFSGGLADSIRYFDCDSVGVYTLDVYATDLVGNQANCSVQITVNDADQQCAPVIDIDGFIQREDGEAIGGVWVELIGDSVWLTQTDDMGYYRFADLPSTSSYSLRPYKDTLPKNGVSVIDLIQMQRHILNTVPLSSPYKLLAADVNVSGTISTFDVIRTRKVILDIDTSFVGNTSWTFVTADYVFPDTLDPWQEDWPEWVDINTTENVSFNWIGIKTGDVNLSANTQTLAEAEVSPHDFTMLGLRHIPPTRENNIGHKFRVEWPPFAKIRGVQFTLAWNPAKWHFQEALLDGQPQVTYFNLRAVAEGRLSFVWHGPLEDSPAPQLSFVFESRGEQASINDFYLANTPTPAEIYVLEGDHAYHSVPRLVYRPAETIDWEIEDFRPNPWSAESALQIRVAEPSLIRLSVFDELGRLVLEKNTSIAVGINTLHLRHEDLPHRGVYFYRLQNGSRQYRGQFVKL